MNASDPTSNDVTTFDNAPLPTARQMKARNNLVVQFGRFIALNLKMIGMVRKGHH
jgi:hypothetical protein